MKSYEYQGLRTWEAADGSHTVVEDGHGNFEVWGANDEQIAVIVPDDSEQIVADLNSSDTETVDGWEDGGGTVITIPVYYKNVNTGLVLSENDYNDMIEREANDLGYTVDELLAQPDHDFEVIQ